MYAYVVALPGKMVCSVAPYSELQSKKKSEPKIILKTILLSSFAIMWLSRSCFSIYIMFQVAMSEVGGEGWMQKLH